MKASLLAVVLALVAGGTLVACSDREPAVGDTTGQQPRLEGPASRYSPALEELPSYLEVYPPETYALTRDLFVFLGPFVDRGEADQFLRDQGFQEGYRAEFHPDGLLAGVVGQGQFYLTVETYLFGTPEGAGRVYERFEQRYSGIQGSTSRDTERVGNRSSGWEYGAGTVGDTETVAVYHRFVFQRGNLIAMVQTYGAEDQMSIEAARQVAAIVDSKASGTTPAIEPTPVGSDVPPAETD